MDTDGPLLDLQGEQEYAQASLEFRKTRSAYYQARSRLVGVIGKLSYDPDGLLEEADTELWPTIEGRHQWLQRHKVTLPATLPQIRSEMNWTTERAHDWLKRQQKAGYIAHRGPRRHYEYYYTDKYNLRAGLVGVSMRSSNPDGTSSNNSVNELDRVQHGKTIHS